MHTIKVLLRNKDIIKMSHKGVIYIGKSNQILLNTIILSEIERNKIIFWPHGLSIAAIIPTPSVYLWCPVANH